MQKLKAASYALTAIIPLIILLATFNALSFYNPDTDKAEIIEHLKTGKTIENIELTKDELTHLEDVRALVKAELIIFYILATLASLLIIAFALPKNKQTVFTSIYHGGLITIGIVLAILPLSFFAFDWAFTIFHKLLFRNDLWLLPTGSKLLELFPKEFFIDFTRKLGLYSIIISALLIIIGKLKRPA